MVSPLELKSKQLILSEFSRNTLATLKLRSTLSVSFMMASVGLGGEAAPRFTIQLGLQMSVAVISVNMLTLTVLKVELKEV